MFMTEHWGKIITAFMITIPILAHFLLYFFCAFLIPRQGLLVCSSLLWFALVWFGLVWSRFWSGPVC